ncbi:7TM domain-containing protein [Kaarinaea lacus]
MTHTAETRLSSKYTLLFVLAITISALIIIKVRHDAMQTEAVPVGDRIWKITLSNQFTATKETSTLHVALPSESPYAKIVRQTVIHPNITLKRPPKLSRYFYEITAVPDQPGEQQLTAELIIHASDTGHWINKSERKQDLKTKERNLFLNDSDTLELDNPKLANALANIRSTATDLSSLEHAIFKFVNERIVLTPDLPFISVPETLQKMRANGLGKTMTFIALCRSSNIPARLVVGVVMREAIGAEMNYWAQVYIDEKWQPYDVEHGYTGELPANYLALAYNRENVSYFEDPTPVDTTIDIEAIPASAGMLGKGKKSVIEIIDLTRLEVTTQHLLAVLLILPFGGLITQFFRQIIGVKMFGTFSAPLLALAMVYADWITVAIIVTTVGIFGLGGRAYIAAGLTRVPRLTIIFIMVAMSMAFAVSFMDYFNMNPNSSAVLLPIVILVSLIDRIYAAHEDYGMLVTLHRVAWTIIVAFFCFLVFNLIWLRHLVLMHPEIHFFTLSLVLLISLYSKPTLFELPALHWIREPIHPKTEKSKHKTHDDQAH